MAEEYVSKQWRVWLDNAEVIVEADSEEEALQEGIEMIEEKIYQGQAHYKIKFVDEVINREI